jgi:CBS-domain-containing membrane protein
VDAPLSKAIEAMTDDQIRRLPVVDGEQRIQGIVSTADLARPRRHGRDLLQTLKTISEPTAAPSKPRARSRGKAA